MWVTKQFLLQLHLTPVWKFLVILKTLIRWIRCVWLGLELNCAELWPSRNWVWDQCFKVTATSMFLRGYLHLVTSCAFFWSDSYPILKRPAVNALSKRIRDGYKSDRSNHLRRRSEPHSRWNWTSVNAYSAAIKERIYICFAKTHLCGQV